jgi:hypothetical protein
VLPGLANDCVKAEIEAIADFQRPLVVMRLGSSPAQPIGIELSAEALRRLRDAETFRWSEKTSLEDVAALVAEAVDRAIRNESVHDDQGAP